MLFSAVKQTENVIFEIEKVKLEKDNGNISCRLVNSEGQTNFTLVINVFGKYTLFVLSCPLIQLCAGDPISGIFNRALRTPAFRTPPTSFLEKPFPESIHMHLNNHAYRLHTLFKVSLFALRVILK